MRIREYIVRVEYDAPPSQIGTVAEGINIQMENICINVVSQDVLDVNVELIADYEAE